MILITDMCGDLQTESSGWLFKSPHAGGGAYCGGSTTGRAEISRNASVHNRQARDRNVGRRMVVARSYCNRTAVESQSNRSCNHRLTFFYLGNRTFIHSFIHRPTILFDDLLTARCLFPWAAFTRVAVVCHLLQLQALQLLVDRLMALSHRLGHRLTVAGKAVPEL